MKYNLTLKGEDISLLMSILRFEAKSIESHLCGLKLLHISDSDRLSRAAVYRERLDTIDDIYADLYVLKEEYESDFNKILFFDYNS